MRLRELPEATLRALADALSSGRLRAPHGAAAVGHVVGVPPWVAGELDRLHAAGVGADGVALALRLVADERAEARARTVELTWTGPAEVVTGTRDTGAVARQLFASATRELVVSTFVVDGGEKAAGLLRVLRERVEAAPGLRVRFFLNVPRPLGDDRPAAALVDAQRRWFEREVWPWTPQPEVYYDRRALAEGRGSRACLHAKCIVQDGVRALVTSANLTEAAQDRNIEAGVLVADAGFAGKVVRQFERLVAAGVLVGW